VKYSFTRRREEGVGVSEDCVGRGAGRLSRAGKRKRRRRKRRRRRMDRGESGGGSEDAYEKGPLYHFAHIPH